MRKFHFCFLPAKRYIFSFGFFSLHEQKSSVKSENSKEQLELLITNHLTHSRIIRQNSEIANNRNGINNFLTMLVRKKYNNMWQISCNNIGKTIRN